MKKSVTFLILSSALFCNYSAASDTFDSSSGILSIPSLVISTPFGSNTYNNVQLHLNSDGQWKVVSYGSTPTPTPTPTPTAQSCSILSTYNTSFNVQLSFTTSSSNYYGYFSGNYIGGTLSNGVLTGKSSWSESNGGGIGTMVIKFSDDCSSFSGTITKPNSSGVQEVLTWSGTRS